jgi:hypothetical protein
VATGSVGLVNVNSVATLAANDSIFVNSNSTVRQAYANGIFANLNVKVATLLVANNSTPANSTINVAQGTIWFDSSYLYLATANNIIKRMMLTSF